MRATSVSITCLTSAARRSNGALAVARPTAANTAASPNSKRQTRHAASAPSSPLSYFAALFSSASNVVPPAAPAAAPSASASNARSFIEVARDEGAAALLGPFPTAGRFDACVRGLTITRMDGATGEAEGWMEVSPAVANAWGTLHGGAIATLVDIMGSLALLTKDHTRAGVSVELNVSYIAAVKAGQRVLCKGRVLKLGKKLGFTQVDLYTEDGKVAATGRHTKAM
jgi:acyl-coenzyme A thioesterase 13